MRFALAAWLWAALLLLSAPASAATGVAQLNEFFNGLKTLKADFQQTVADAQFATPQSATGTLAISRPGKFRWDYREPYQQLIVADGKKVWIYDVDLEQVTVKSLGETLGNTPALLLSSDEPLERNFSLKDLGDQDGLAWVELDPKDSDVSFSRIRLGFNGGVLRKMELLDNLGQTTLLSFKKVQRNPSLDAGLFRFAPPQGVDIFNATE